MTKELAFSEAKKHSSSWGVSICVIQESKNIFSYRRESEVSKDQKKTVVKTFNPKK